MNPIDDFLADIDAHWQPQRGEASITLKIIGSSALHLQTGYGRGTKDGDVLETAELEGPIGQRLTALAGQGTRLHDRHGIYLDLVGVGIPFLPLEPLWHAADVRLNHFNVLVLDVADVLVSKLKRYAATDREDIRQMIDGRHVGHARMLARLLEVIEWHKYDGRSDALPVMAERFNQVERDWFGVEETPIQLPHEVFR